MILVRPFLLAANIGLPLALYLSHGNPLVLTPEVLAHVLLGWAMIAPRCQWLGPVASTFKTNKRELWLTIDDGIGPDSVVLARELGRRGVRATFFAIGKTLPLNAEAAREILACGHELGNHSHTHPTAIFWGIDIHRLGRELDHCSAELRRAGQEAVTRFRAPVGIKHILLGPLLNRRGMRLIAWRVRGRDGIARSIDQVVERITSRVRPGDILMLHEGRSSSNETILRVVDILSAQNYQFVIPANEQLQ